MVMAAVYARISLDRQDGAGVERQLEDGIALARKRGWDLVEYVDNSLTAFRRKKRPEWLRLLADLRSGRVQAVVGYHTDRFYRRVVELEDLILIAEQMPIEIATAMSGDLDLNTASGRANARMLVVFAQHESERIGERVTRAKKQRAIEGRAAGGGRRPFGLSDDRKKLNPKEAAEIRRIADAVRTGSSTWTSQVDRLNAKGMLTSSGNLWTVGSLRRALTSPYVAGLRSYHGEIVGRAEWPAILERDVWEDLKAAVETRRRGRPPSDRHLLTGLLVCGKCGFRMYATERKQRTVRAYSCTVVATTKGKGCGGVSIAAQPLEDHVERLVLGWLADPKMVRAIQAAAGGTTVDVAEQRDELNRRRQWLAKRWADGDITGAAFDIERAELERRQSEVAAEVLRLPRAKPALDVASLAKLWPNMTVPEKRAAIGTLAVTPIVVQPAEKGGRLEDRVDVRPAV